MFLKENKYLKYKIIVLFEILDFDNINLIFRILNVNKFIRSCCI